MSNSADWDAIRKQVLERDGYRCVKCGIEVRSLEADIHHLLPRSFGGSDQLSNLVTLCDGCHASHHPNLAGGLARRVIERWAVRLAKWLDTQDVIGEGAESLGPALRMFGVQRFRAGQLPIVLAALSGKSILVVSPTGSGKTLCFQLPAVLQDHLSLVVSPLKALMAQQVSDLLAKKIPATFINGDLSKAEKTTRYELLANNALKFLYVAPERFYVRSAEERENVLGLRPAYMVIDEAHCVDQWGQDFRPEYGRLGDVRRKLGSPSVLAFTATAGTEMQQRILSSLGIEDARVFVRDVDRPNILLVRRKQDPDKRALEISQLLRLPQLKGGKSMVFVPSVRVGEQLVADLAELGLDVPIYHSNLGTPWDREQLLKRFAGESQPACDHIICTSAFGMGLDIPNVRLTIHWQHPATVEDLLQEFGRAGRDGKPSVSVIFHNGRRDRRDADRLKFMAERTIESSDASGRHADQLLAQRKGRIDQVAGMLDADICLRRQILTYFEGSSAHRLSLSEKILDWVFGSRSRRNRGTRCCDYCDRERIKKIGVREYVAGAL